MFQYSDCVGSRVSGDYFTIVVSSFNTVTVSVQGLFVR